VTCRASPAKCALCNPRQLAYCTVLLFKFLVGSLSCQAQRVCLIATDRIGSSRDPSVKHLENLTGKMRESHAESTLITFRSPRFYARRHLLKEGIRHFSIQALTSSCSRMLPALTNNAVYQMFHTENGDSALKPILQVIDVKKLAPPAASGAPTADRYR